MKIVFTGGGTAGHIFPIISIVREIKRNNLTNDFQFFYIGPDDKFARDLLKKEGIEVKTIFSGKIRRYFSLQNIIDVFFKIPLGFLQSFYYLFVISPDLIFSKGGYGSIPVVVSGWLLATPIFIHESDACLGLANRIASKFALEVFGAFPIKRTSHFSKKKIISIGNPIRQEILVPPPNSKELLELKEEKPVIFFIGGSQGSQRINEELLADLENFLESFEIIHQTGEENFEEIKKGVEFTINKDLKKYYHPFPFLSENKLAASYHSADLVVSRAGGGAIFEIAAVGKPSILIPLPGSAQEHQVKNAYIYAETGAAIVIEEANFRPHFLLTTIKTLFAQPEKMKLMSKAAENFSKPMAGKIIAKYIISYLK